MRAPTPHILTKRGLWNLPETHITHIMFTRLFLCELCLLSMKSSNTLILEDWLPNNSGKCDSKDE